MRTPIFVCLLLLAAPLISSAQAQEVGTVTGRIIDQAGQPLPAVQVVIDGSNLNARTDAQGRYSITGVPTGEVAVVASSLGYGTQRQAVTVVAGQTVVADLALQISAIQLDEIVAVGYGTQRRETLTGSISTVSGETVALSPAPNLSAGLAGRLPGLTVNQRSGTPGSENMDIVIRGLGTYAGTNTPLIIVDGVERDNFQRLNPDDVESVTVLKDASAAIYGARAANGVILVTTKRGAVGAAQFDVSFESAFSTPTMIPDMLSSGEFAEFFNEARWYDAGRPQNWTPTYTDDAIQKYYNGSDPVLYPNTDWPGVSYKSHSLQRNLGIRATGGTEDVQYRVSFGYTDQNTDVRNSDQHYTRYNLRAVLDAQLTENLKLGANIAGTINKSVGGTGDGFTIFLSNPTLVAIYPNGLVAGGRFGNSSLLSNRRGLDTTEDTPIYTSFTAEYEAPFLDGLRFDASFNYDQRNSFRKDFNTPHTFHEYNTATGEYELQTGEQTSISLTDTYQRWTTLLTNLRATYTNTFAVDHNLSLMVGGEQQKDRNWRASAGRAAFVSGAIPQIDVGSSSAEDLRNSGSAGESAYNNLLGRANYDFQSKYLAEFVFRYDGSPTFAEGKRYSFFPSVSVGWRLSEEAFFQERFPFVNDLKLRASRGKVGSDAVGDYQYLQAFSFDGNYVFGGVDAPGIRSSSLPNPNITWEESLKTDVGFEATMWDGGLGVDFTYWREHRTGILSAPQLAISRVFGFPSLPDLNIGETKGSGYEFVLSHSRVLSPEVSYNLSANVAYAKSDIIYLDEVPPSEDYQKREGSPVDADLYYVSDGIFNDQAELDNSPHSNNTQLGDIKLRDMNEDGVINADDRVRWDQSETPDYILGLNAGLRYKNLDVQLFFQGQAGAVIYDGVHQDAGHTDGRNTWLRRSADRWTVDNPDGTMPRAGVFTTAPGGGGSDFFLFDATFMRLKTLEVGFTLPENLTARLPEIENARLYVSGFNVLTWAKEIKWVDPELTSGTTYPPQRILNLGVNVTF